MYLRYETPEVFPKHRHISPTTFLVFVTLFVFSTFSLVTSVLRSNDDVSWDLLIFTQNWPVSVCRKYTEESKTNKCTKFPNNTWTIHGLWPTKKGKIGPNFCNKSRPFSPEAIYGIEEELEKWWSPVEVHKSKYMFWSHEWEKHGTCAAVLPQFATEFDYFYQVLQLIKQYNITEILAKAGITPGQSYNVTKIWDGVKGVLNKNPQIFCYEEKGNVSVLLEVRICLDKSLNLVDCDGTVVGYEPRVDPWIRGMRYKRLAGGYHNLTNCKIERPVQFPPGYMMFTPENTPEVQTQTETNSLLENLKILRLAEWFTG